MSLTVNKIGYNNTTFTRTNDNKHNKEAGFITKAASAAGSTAGLIGATIYITKKRGYKLPTLNDKKQIIKIIKNLEFKAKDVILLASSSVAGGLICGTLTDTKHAKAKRKEGLTQLVGNYIIPSLFVCGGMKLNKILNKTFKFPPVKKSIQAAFGTAGFISGVIVGNRISRSINKHIYKENDNRRLNWKDWFEQADNVCLVTSMANPGTKLAKKKKKIIPLAHILPGYCTGIKRDI